MSQSPPIEEPAPPGPLRRLRDSYGALSPVARELLIFAALLLVSVLSVPFAIWFVGNRMLGPYTHGQNLHAGPLALAGDFFVGLAHGSAVFWGVALGPPVFILLLRLLIRVLRIRPARRG
jgi:hypothetical protein